jgi:hypothetical protein
VFVFVGVLLVVVVLGGWGTGAGVVWGGGLEVVVSAAPPLVAVGVGAGGEVDVVAW